MASYVLIFFLGFFQFYSIVFIPKYLTFSIFSDYSLFYLSAISITSLILTYFSQKKFKQISKFHFLIYFSLIYLSHTNISHHLAWVFIAIIIIFLIIQTQVVKLFTLNFIEIRHAYGIELLGGVFGVFAWQQYSSLIGFKGYIFIAIFSQIAWHIIFEKKITYLNVGLVLLCILTIKEPEPLINKRDRQNIVNQGQFLKRYWDPNACIEFIRTSNDLVLVLFDGGNLRTHINKFDNNFINLRQRFIDSESAYVWGLDVVVPHFSKDGQKTKVALISALGGQEILAAKAFGAFSIYAIDINETAQKKIINDFYNFSLGTYKDVTPINADGRYFIEHTKERFDIIQIYSTTNTSYSSLLGASLRPSSLITVEAFKTYMNSLNDDGILSITQYSYHKIKSTLIAALGDDLFTHQNKVFSIKRKNKSYDLTSFYIKKNGWSENEIKKIQLFLNNDKTTQWMTLYSPYDKNNEITDYKSARTLQSLPVTDNRPFGNLETEPIKISQFFILVVLFFGVLAISAIAAIYFYKFKGISSTTLGSSFLSGTSFYLAQAGLILLFQKIFGSPSLGIAVGITSTLICPILALAAFRIFTGNKFKFYLIFIISIIGLILCGTTDVQHEIIFAAAILISCLLQSILYNHFIQQNKDLYLNIFLFNGLGAVIGLWLFYILYALVGFNFVLIILSLVYIFAFATLHKNLDIRTTKSNIV